MQRHAWTDERIDDMVERVDQRFDAVDRRFDAVDQRFDAVDQRFEAVDRRFDLVDARFDRIEGELRDVRVGMDRLNDRITQLALAMSSLQMATVIAILVH